MHDCHLIHSYNSSEHKQHYDNYHNHRLVSLLKYWMVWVITLMRLNGLEQIKYRYKNSTYKAKIRYGQRVSTINFIMVSTKKKRVRWVKSHSMVNKDGYSINCLLKIQVLNMVRTLIWYEKMIHSINQRP